MNFKLSRYLSIFYTLKEYPFNLLFDSLITNSYCTRTLEVNINPVQTPVKSCEKARNGKAIIKKNNNLIMSSKVSGSLHCGNAGQNMFLIYKKKGWITKRKAEMIARIAHWNDFGTSKLKIIPCDNLPP